VVTGKKRLFRKKVHVYLPIFEEELLNVLPMVKARTIDNKATIFYDRVKLFHIAGSGHEAVQAAASLLS
jgi:hypothetical protein